MVSKMRSKTVADKGALDGFYESMRWLIDGFLCAIKARDQKIQAMGDVMVGWKTIETAPKDGSTILVFGEGEISVAFWENPAGYGFWRCIGYGILACEENGVPYGRPPSLIHQNPTHWMPLPEQPNNALHLSGAALLETRTRDGKG